MSGIGKGVIAASIGKILQVRGLKVTAAKVDPYLNYDAGTMNPYIHGEVFVTEDGGEIGNVVNVHVTLVPMLDVVGEQKTKPTQHSVQELRRIGVQPDVIVARSKVPLKPEPRKKIALFCNVEESAVFTSQDIASIYESPLLLDEQGLGSYMVNRLQLSSKEPEWSSWKKMIKTHLGP